MRQKGQISIEFMLLLLFVIIFIGAVIMPGVSIATSSAEDVARVSQARLAVEKIANSVEEIASLGGDARKTVHIFVPQDAEIHCDEGSKEIFFEIRIGEKIAKEYTPNECPSTGGNNCCEKPLTDGNPAVCNYHRLVSSLNNCAFDTLFGKEFYDIIIEKIGGNLNIRTA